MGQHESKPSSKSKNNSGRGNSNTKTSHLKKYSSMTEEIGSPSCSKQDNLLVVDLNNDQFTGSTSRLAALKTSTKDANSSTKTLQQHNNSSIMENASNCKDDADTHVINPPNKYFVPPGNAELFLRERRTDDSFDVEESSSNLENQTCDILNQPQGKLGYLPVQLTTEEFGSPSTSKQDNLLVVNFNNDQHTGSISRLAELKTSTKDGNSSTKTLQQHNNLSIIENVSNCRDDTDTPVINTPNKYFVPSGNSELFLRESADSFGVEESLSNLENRTSDIFNQPQGKLGYLPVQLNTEEIGSPSSSKQDNLLVVNFNKDQHTGSTSRLTALKASTKDSTIDKTLKNIELIAENKTGSVDPNKSIQDSVGSPSSSNKGNLLVVDLNDDQHTGSTLRLAALKTSTKDLTIDKTLKHIELIAENITGSVDLNKSRQDSVGLEFTDSAVKEKHNQWMLRNCVVKMRNVREDDTKFVSTLQKEILSILKEVEYFTSSLKTCPRPVINSDMYSLSEMIRENLRILEKNHHIECNYESSLTHASSKEHFKNWEIEKPNYFHDETKINYNLSVGHDNSNGIHASNNPSLKLLEALNNPGDKRIESFNDPCDSKSSPSKERFLNACPEEEPVVNMDVLPNHKGVLDLIAKSVSEGCSFDVNVHICLFCDFFENDQTNAQIHVSSNHTDQPHSVWNFCKTCAINIYGSDKLYKEHCLTAGHINIAKLKGECLPEELKESIVPEPNSSHEQQLSLDDCGPHYSLMKAVLREKITNNNANACGFYCQICEVYFLDRRQYDIHVQDSSHITMINSTGISGNIVLHHCENCNINLLCNEQFFSLHIQHVVHKAMARLPVTREEIEEAGSEVSSVGDEADFKNSENRSINTVDASQKYGNLQEKNNQKEKFVKNGVYFKGLPPDFFKKDIAEYFKMFGPLNTLNIIQKQGCGTVVFKNREDAEKVLQRRNFIRGIQVEVKPLKATAAAPRLFEKVKLHPNVAHVMSSIHSLEAAVSGSLSEMQINYVANQQKSVVIREDLSATMPGCRVLFFGSQVTGLATAQSDFDLYVDYDGKSFYHNLSYEKQNKIIDHFNYNLTRRGSKFLVREIILEARVPIMRLVHMKTNTKCDVSFRNGLAVENSQLIKLYLDLDPRVRWLVVTVKLWMDLNGLLDRTKFTSYATIWLVLFCLMRLPEPVVCPVTSLQRNCKPHFVAKWDCRFHRDMKDVSFYFRTVNRYSNLELLSFFFKSYATFPFKNSVMCPLNGKVLTRQQFKNLPNLPAEFKPYVDKFRFANEWEKIKISSPVCLQDPFDLSHNITKGVNRTDLEYFQALCHKTYMMCQDLLAQ